MTLPNIDIPGESFARFGGIFEYIEHVRQIEPFSEFNRHVILLRVNELTVETVCQRQLEMFRWQGALVE